MSDADTHESSGIRALLRRDFNASVTSIVLLLVGTFSLPSFAQCDLTLSDNTYRAGLDFMASDSQSRERIKTVESFHFTAEVEALRRGSTGPMPEDLEYTLRHIPNHHRALIAYANWESKASPLSAGSRPRSSECYFQRALRFRPGDLYLHVLFGVALHRSNRHEEARKQYQLAEDSGLSTAELYYNRGLLELDLGNASFASEYATKAYGLGYPLPGLRRRLEELGQRQPEPGIK